MLSGQRIRMPKLEEQADRLPVGHRAEAKWLPIRKLTASTKATIACRESQTPKAHEVDGIVRLSERGETLQVQLAQLSSENAIDRR